MPARYSPDGSRIASGHDTIQIRNAHDARIQDEVRGLGGNVWWLDWTPDGEVVAATSGTTARIWSTAMRRGVAGFAGHGSPDLDASPSGELLACTSDRGAVFLCGVDGELLEERPVTSIPARARFSSDGELVVAAHGSRDFFSWRSAPGAPLERFETPFKLEDHPPVRLADDRWLLWGDYRQILLWTVGESELRPRRDRAFPELTNSFAVSPDRKGVLTGGFGDLRLSTLEGEELWRSNAGQTVNVSYFVFSPDGTQALTASSDGNAYLWNPGGEGEAVAVFRAHRSALNGAAFSSDGRLVATSSVDGEIRVWDRASRRTTLSFRHEGVSRVVFTAKGQLVSSGSDGTVRWWWLEVEPLRLLVEALDVPELSEQERERLGRLPD